MALVVIVTRDVAYRYRGFLASVMLEVAPAVYISPRMSPAVRGRVWIPCRTGILQNRKVASSSYGEI